MRELGKKLHDNCKEHSFHDTEKILESELGKSWKDIFVCIWDKPIASGAIAQVHRATLLVDGDLRDVAIKVMHPWVVESVEQDLKVLNGLAKMMTWSAHFANAKIVHAMKEFEIAMLGQLDFVKEAENNKTFATLLKGWKDLRVPDLYEDYITKRVLTMEYIEGITMTRILDHPDKYDTQFKVDVCEIGLMGFFKMFLKDYFLHVDMHPGNMIVQETKMTRIEQDSNDPQNTKTISYSKPNVVLVDFGLCYRIAKHDADRMKNLFESFVDDDYEEAAEIMWRFSNMKNLPESSELKQTFKKEMMKVFEPVREKDIMDLELGPLFNDSMKLMHQYGIKFEPNFANLIISVVVLEGVGKQLNPKINIVDTAVRFKKVYSDWKKQHVILDNNNNLE